MEKVKTYIKNKLVKFLGIDEVILKITPYEKHFEDKFKLINYNINNQIAYLNDKLLAERNKQQELLNYKIDMLECKFEQKFIEITENSNSEM